jgi:hypothetical protein
VFLKNERLGDETTIDTFTDFVSQPSAGTIYSDKFSSKPAAYFNCDDADKLITCLGAFHERILTRKEDAYLISPAVFDPDKVAGTSRGIGNIIHLRHLWFDFEDGDLPPEEVPALFPHTRMAVMNTYHHTREKPRFRVVIPTTQIVTPEAHQQLYAEFAAKLEDAKYGVERKRRRHSLPLRSGLDWSKSYPHSIFYLPSQAQDPAQSFFNDYAGGDRIALDPVLWLENSAIPLQPEVEAESEHPAQFNKEMVQAAAAIWRESSAYPGEGNQRFFEFALALRRAGMGNQDIRSTLRSEAEFGRTPQERRAQIPSIINSLRQRRSRQPNPA